MVAHAQNSPDGQEPSKKLPIDFLPEILELVAQGRTLRETTRELRDFGGPPESTVRSWVLFDDPPGTAAQYARARELQLEAWADEIHELSTKPQIGEKTETDASGAVIKITTGDTVERSRLAVDTRKWLMSKLAPKKYGEKVAIEATGPRKVSVTLIPSDQGREIDSPAGATDIFVSEPGYDSASKRLDGGR